jgi:serine/threonine-protein kinase
MSTQSAVAPTVPGTVLAGKYRVERILGTGGMGVVVEAKHIALDERVALKFLLPEYAYQHEAAGRFLREAKAAVKIKSEHVARVTDVGTLETGAPYMVMEYLDGRDLSQALESGVLGVQDAVDYIIQGCDALAEAHGYGIVHRDIKPANLFLTRRPNGMPLVKILDFGISKTTGSQVDNLTKTSASMGSALYMSPEQMQQTRGVDHRTDIYALGITLYELLAGKQPFYAETLPQLCAEIFTGQPTPIRSVRPDVPEGLAHVLEKAYARDRGVRFQSIGELVLALAPYAPPRSQAVIESVARMAGLPAPTAGAPGLPVAPPPSGPTGPQLVGNAPVVGATPHFSTDTLPSRVSQPSFPVLGGTGPGVTVTSPAPAPSSKFPLFALAAVALMALSSGGMYLAMRPGSSAATGAATPEAAAPATATVGVAAAPQTAAPTAPTSTEAAAPPPAAPTATAVASTTPSAVAVTPKGPGARGGAKAAPPPVFPPPVRTAPPPGKDVGF